MPYPYKDSPITQRKHIIVHLLAGTFSFSSSTFLTFFLVIFFQRPFRFLAYAPTALQAPGYFRIFWKLFSWSGCIWTGLWPKAFPGSAPSVGPPRRGMEKHDLTLLLADFSKGVKEHLPVRSLFQGFTVRSLFLFFQLIKGHIAYHFLFPEPHIAEIPGNGKDPGQGFSQRDIGFGLGPYAKICFLHQVLCLIRAFCQ